MRQNWHSPTRTNQCRESISLFGSCTHRLGLAQVPHHAGEEGRLADERRDVARRGGVEVRLGQVRRRGPVEVPVAAAAAANAAAAALAAGQPDVAADLAAEPPAVVARGRILGPQRAGNDAGRI